MLIFLLLSFKNYRYILDASTLLYMCFMNIFSHSVACLPLLLVSFSGQKYILLTFLSHEASFFFLFAFCEFHGFLINRIWNVKLGQFFVPDVKKTKSVHFLSFQTLFLSALSWHRKHLFILWCNHCDMEITCRCTG